MQTISRLYAHQDNARSALAELRRRGFADSYLFTPPPRGEGETAAPASTDSILQEMMKAYIVRSDAAVFAKRVSEGASLVAVHAPFTGGYWANTVLDRYGPIPSGLPERREAAYGWDEAAPLSSALHLPVLAKNEHPFELVSGVPSLIRTKEDTGVRVRPDNPAPLSGAVGWSLLSNEPAPLSKMFGMRLLLKSGPLFA